MANPLIYPWLEKQWQQLQKDRDRLPHALLFSGAQGLGKLWLAQTMAQSLLCSDPVSSGQPCLKCKSCGLIKAGSHPDYRLLAPEEEGKAIIVNQIRSLVEYLALRPYFGQQKIIIIHPAEEMNRFAANSLLKMLEEPPLGNIIILVSHREARLPATIRSRCSRIRFTKPDQQCVRKWLTAHMDADQADILLQLTLGAPLHALALFENDFLSHRGMLLDDLEEISLQKKDPIQCAAQWQKIGSQQCIHWLQVVVSDMVKMTLLETPPALHNPDIGIRLQGLAKRLHLKELFSFSEKLTEVGRLITTPLDERLLLEDSLICWLRLYRRS